MQFWLFLAENSFYGRINWVFHIFFMLFFAVLGIVLFVRFRRERVNWDARAESLNLIYQDRGSTRLDAYLELFDLLGNSALKDPTQCLAGAWRESEILAFNWFYQSDKTVTALRGGFVGIIMDLGKDLGRLRCWHKDLQPFADKMEGEIMVLSDEALMKQYGLVCRNRRQAERFFCKDLVELLLKKKYWLELHDDKLLIAWQGAMEPDTAIESLNRAVDFVESLHIGKNSFS